MYSYVQRMQYSKKSHSLYAVSMEQTVDHLTMSVVIDETEPLLLLKVLKAESSLTLSELSEMKLILDCDCSAYIKEK